LANRYQTRSQYLQPQEVDTLPKLKQELEQQEQQKQ
jgi:hypothetical protein